MPLIFLVMNFPFSFMHLMMVSFATFVQERGRWSKRNLFLYYLFWLKFYGSWISNFNLFLFQAKADEIAKLMNENEQLKAVIEDLKVCQAFFFPLDTWTWFDFVFVLVTLIYVLFFCLLISIALCMH